jgi:putative DNA primase/helicase
MTASPVDMARRRRSEVDFIPFDDPRRAAWALIAVRFALDGQRTLHFWQGEFHRFDGAAYARMPKADVRATLYSVGGLPNGKPLKREHVENVLDALRAAANYSNTNSMPSWIVADQDDPEPRSLILLRNGMLDPATRVLRPPSPRLFAANALPFEYQPHAPHPAAWLKFLGDLWDDDVESVLLLQEWIGYLLTSRTEQQKALLLVGPKRGGKGTIGRVIGRLLGAHNMVSPTLASLGTQFGLQPLIGRLLALISDARLGSRADAALMAENVLRVTGEDQISIPRKFMEDFTCTLPTRLMLLTNELPRFTDASGALPSRFLVLQTTKSWFGREDHRLDRRLEAELPSILNWSLDGLERLSERGRFVQPASALQAIAEMEALASPVGAFVADACNVGPQYEEPVKAVYDAWRQWCDEGGREHPGTEQTFGRDLKAAVPGLVVRQPRRDGDRVRVYQGIGLK